jgi:hypothetical protein
MEQGLSATPTEPTHFVRPRLPSTRKEITAQCGYANGSISVLFSALIHFQSKLVCIRTDMPWTHAASFACLPLARPSVPYRSVPNPVSPTPASLTSWPLCPRCCHPTLAFSPTPAPYMKTLNPLKGVYRYFLFQKAIIYVCVCVCVKNNYISFMSSTKMSTSK